MFLFDQINESESESESDDRISHLLYADDLTLMAENENDLQTVLTVLKNGAINGAWV